MTSIKDLPEQNRFSYSILAKLLSVSLSALKLAVIKLNIQPQVNDRGVVFLSRVEVEQVINHLGLMNPRKNPRCHVPRTAKTKNVYYKCHVCNEEFNTHPIKRHYKSIRKVLVFCSTWCANNIQPRSIIRYSEFRPSKICKACNEKYNFKHEAQNYCSKICASRFRTKIKKKSVQTNCSNPECKKPLEICNSYFKRATSHYCSNLCKNKSGYKNTNQAIRKSEIVSLICKTCLEPFRYIQSISRSATRQYCSLKCSRDRAIAVKSIKIDPH